MAVTELATLPLTRGTLASSPELLTGLYKAKVLMETQSGFKFNFSKQVEDPTLIYIVGAWSSPLAHQTYIQTSENKAVVQSLQAQVDIEGIIMYHVELDPDDAPLPLDAPVISVNKHFIKAGQRQAFEREFGQVQHLLQNYTKPRPTAAGWRIEKESDDKEEWILFSV
jgi:heme-degrading monooxygenase HmoA